MKYMQTLIAMVVGGLVLALGSSAVAQTVKPCVVTVVRIQGQARYSLGDNIWHPLVVGKILGAGAVIQSAVDATVDIVLSGNPVAMPQAASTPQTIGYATDPNVRGLMSYKPMVQQNVIRMFGNTVLAVDKLTQADTGVDTVSDTELDLRAGRIFFNVKKMSVASQFFIKIPNGVAGIRGSAGSMLVAPPTLTNPNNLSAAAQQEQLQLENVSMWIGEMVVALGNGQTFTVDGGNTWTPGSGLGSASQSVLGDLANLGMGVSTFYVESITVANSANVPNVAQCYVTPVIGQ
jgi:hypothetical protein